MWSSDEESVNWRGMRKRSSWALFDVWHCLLLRVFLLLAAMIASIPKPPYSHPS